MTIFNEHITQVIRQSTAQSVYHRQLTVAWRAPRGHRLEELGALQRRHRLIFYSWFGSGDDVTGIHAGSIDPDRLAHQMITRHSDCRIIMSFSRNCCWQDTDLDVEFIWQRRKTRDSAVILWPPNSPGFEVFDSTSTFKSIQWHLPTYIS